ncbi:GNAT family N-acetyltransferase [Halococcus sediminicola]|uniref:GNAT family N-acetyltransferase n=1 Tax=Halococcus sediminicola TaxID=1264579 RepID=UPI0013775C2B|nr:GNAT family N-acetyltransferase [Halococcus sediminicola]
MTKSLLELREPETADVERIRELIESTLTASYALSPQQIEALLKVDFDVERLAETFEASDSVTLVAESTVNGTKTTVGGIFEGEFDVDGGSGEVRWLFVDPEHRGGGIGTELFETAVGRLRKQGAERITATTLEANREGPQFFEQFGFKYTDDRQVEFAGEPIVEHVYAEHLTETETASESDSEGNSDTNLPNTETTNGVTTATADDSKQAYISLIEEDSGTEGSFFVAYIDEDHTDQFGYYCANCGSLDTAMDNVGRIEVSTAAMSVQSARMKPTTIRIYRLQIERATCRILLV